MILDAEKVQHFVVSLARLPGPMLNRRAGHYLWLPNTALQLQLAYPSRAASFDGPLGFGIDDVQGLHIMAHVGLPPDAGLARSRAEHAAASLPASVAELDQVKRAEADGLARLRPQRVAGPVSCMAKSIVSVRAFRSKRRACSLGGPARPYRRG